MEMMFQNGGKEHEQRRSNLPNFGACVTATGMSAGMYDVVRVGNEGLMGEVIELHGDKAVIRYTKIRQVFDLVNQLSTRVKPSRFRLVLVC